MDGGGYHPTSATSMSTSGYTVVDSYTVCDVPVGTAYNFVPAPPQPAPKVPWLSIIALVGGFVALMAFMTGGWKPIYEMFLSDDQVAAMRATDAVVAQVKMFSVACPPANLSAADQQRWASYAQGKGWTPYPAAGPGCVDP
jgi:hypothetical protein